MNLRELQADAENHSKQWFGGDESNCGEWGSYFHILFLCTALSEELGEVAGPIKKMVRDNKPLPSDHNLEFADVLTYLMLLASALGYDLEEALETKKTINAQRFG